MRKDIPILRFGTRGSKLALVQWEQAVGMLEPVLPGFEFERAVLSTPGDRDRAADIVAGAPDDFFTRDLDLAVLRGEIDAAVHSAKDLPEKPADGIGWTWLPQGDDPRDVLVCREGEAPGRLKAGGKIGVSSQRRRDYAQRRFPHLTPALIRGNVEERIARLDAGHYDLLILAAAGLNRLGVARRISEYIPLAELPSPPGQGRLALTFRAADPVMRTLTSLFIKPVVFAGAGAGRETLITLEAINALERAEVCLFDALVAPAMLARLPEHCQRIFAGKRSGDHALEQEEINRLLVLHARRGMRVVRLKGGDPGIFGRLAEELAALESAYLPYRLIPGISSLNAAALANGIVLTQRGISEGFAVVSATLAEGRPADMTAARRAELPCVFFMGTEKIDALASSYRAEGAAGTLPAAVFALRPDGNAECVRGTLDTIAGDFKASGIQPPALVLIGPPAAPERAHLSQAAPLSGMRVLLTGSPQLHGAASAAVHDYGGIPVDFPLIELSYEPGCEAAIRRIREFDFVMLTSPGSPGFLKRALSATGQDWRAVPAIIAAGRRTAEALLEHGIRADVAPEKHFGAEGILEKLTQKDFKICPSSESSDAAPISLQGKRVLKLTSNLADPRLSAALAGLGADVTECVLYNNRARPFERLPKCDIIFLASGSAVAALARRADPQELASKLIVPIGAPTANAMASCRLHPFVVPGEATAGAALAALAMRLTGAKIENLFNTQRNASP